MPFQNSLHFYHISLGVIPIIQVSPLLLLTFQQSLVKMSFLHSWCSVFSHVITCIKDSVGSLSWHYFSQLEYLLMSIPCRCSHLILHRVTPRAHLRLESEEDGELQHPLSQTQLLTVMCPAGMAPM